MTTTYKAYGKFFDTCEEAEAEVMKHNPATLDDEMPDLFSDKIEEYDEYGEIQNDGEQDISYEDCDLY